MHTESPPSDPVASTTLSTPATSAPAPAGDDVFRVIATEDLTAVLRRLVDEDVPVTLQATGCANEPTLYHTALWGEDASSDLLVLSADAGCPAIHSLVEAGAAQAIAQLDHVEVRFPLERLALVKGRDTWALHAAYPLEMQRFQRRNGYRVRPLDYSQPVVRVRPAESADAGMEMGVALPVIDMSHGGMLLRLPGDTPAPVVDDTLDGVLQLDGLVHVHLLLRVVHVKDTARHIGCEITEVAPQHARALQRYIDHTQRRRRMLML